MDDPREAGKALREHAKTNGMSLDETQPNRALDLQIEEPKKTKLAQKTWLIHVFNRTEFIPAPGVEETLLSRARTAQSSLFCILQMNDNLKLGEIIGLLEEGVKVYEQVGENAVVARVPPDSVGRLATNPTVRWLGEYKPEYKYASPPSTSRKLGAFIYPFGGDRQEYRADLEKLGIQIRGYDTSARFYDVVLDSERFAQVAETLDWVKGIHREPEEHLLQMTDVTVNFEPNDSRELIMAPEGYYTGAGVIVGVRDGGVYATHPQLAGIFNAASELSVADNHGTHVTGIIAGRCTSITGPWGESSVKGVAPAATILFRNFLDWPDNTRTYWVDFLAFSLAGVQISNHSYRFDVGDYSYDADTANFDAYCDNNDMVVVVAAGNDSNESTINNPATGKNVLTVGAIEYVTDLFFHDTEIGRLAPYSSQGPTTSDVRLKPDLVAPGWSDCDADEHKHGVVSTASDPWTHPCSDNSGNIDGNYQFPEWESDDSYIRISGTSMAAPHVAGVCAMIKEWSSGISSEMMKALLINTTIILKANTGEALGGYANTAVGYGMVNASSPTTDFVGDSGLESEHLMIGQDTLEENDSPLWRDHPISVPSGTKQLAVTLAYNDEEGERNDSNALKDDLDLILISPSGETLYAHHYLPANVSTESPLEKMIINDPASGTWIARVQFADSPGFPGHDPYGLIWASQRYAVVAHAIYYTPQLGLSVPQTVLNVQPGETFTLQPTIQNTGGYIAAGVTIQVSGDVRFEGFINKSRYLRNLVYQGAAVTPSLSLIAPTDQQSYTLTLQADGINKGLNSPQVTVVVNVDATGDGVTGLAAKTSSTGSSISQNVWQQDDDPYFYWNAPSSPSPIVGYSISLDTLPDDTVDVTTPYYQYSSHSIANGTHTFYVKAKDAEGNWGSSASFVINVDDVMPTNPTSISSSSHSIGVCSTDPTIDVSWYGASDADSHVYAYSIEWSQSADTLPDQIDEVINTSTTSPTLSDGNWYFHIRTRDWANNWAGTAAHQGPYCIRRPPAAPSNLSATTVSPHQINLNWTANSLNENGFKVERSTDGTVFSPAVSLGAGVTSYQDTNLVACTTYFYRVRAYNGVGNSSYSDVASAMTICVGSLRVIIKPRCAVDGGAKWQVDGGSWHYGGTTVSDVPVGQHTVHFSSLPTGDPPDDNESVTIENEQLTTISGTYSQSIAPDAPSNLTASPVSAMQINLNWQDNSDKECGFKIERAASGDGPWTQIAQVSPNVTSYRNTGLFPDTTYYYRARAYNCAGDSDYCDYASTSTPELCPTSVVGWGEDWYHQASPTEGLTGVVAIAAGRYYSLALKSDRTAVGWGYGDYGQATPPEGLTGVVAIAAGPNHSLALESDGTVVGWGYNAYGQSTGTPTESEPYTASGTVAVNGEILSNVVAIAAGEEHSLALKSDGTVVGWGSNGDGQASPLEGLTGVVAIAAGWKHSQALKSDGTVVGWGSNGDGQASPPEGLTGVVAIAAGWNHSLALKSDDTVVVWGNYKIGRPTNDCDVATSPEGLTGVVAIATGGTHSLALKNDGTIAAWGCNWYGQVTPPEGLTGVVAIAAGEDHSLAIACIPSAPSTLTAIAVSPNQVDLNWTDNSSNENHFRIERATSATGPWSEIGSVDSDVTTYSDTEVGCGQAYFYRVRAYNAVVGSAYSNIASAPALDTDGDMIPDCWMLAHFGHATGQEIDASRAIDDLDGDGLTNLQEYLTGTDPADPNSAFRITALEQSGADIRVSFTSVAGKYYALDRCDIIGGAWTNIVDNIPGNDDIQQATDIDGATRPSAFYRVRLNQSPNPALADSDGDGIPDTWMQLYFGHPTGTESDLSRAGDDADGDNLINLQEYHAATDPWNLDTDVDGLSDGEEVYAYGTNPVKADTDGDSMPDGWEVASGLSPLDGDDGASDSDGDGMSNLQEYLAGTDPTDSTSALRITAVIPVDTAIRVYFTSVSGKYYSLGRCDFMGGVWTSIVDNIPGNDGIQWVKDIGGSSQSSAFYRLRLSQLGSPPPEDSDGDGIPDTWTQRYFGHPIGLESDRSRAEDDPDGDDLTNLQEYLAGTDPWNLDTDGDGLSDSDEVYAYGTDPVKADTDGDSMPDGWEVASGLNPLDGDDGASDSDGDGMSNLQEYLTGTDPTNSASAFRITGIEQEGDDIRVTWTTGGGRTNVLQASPGDANGSYTNDFVGISDLIIIPGSGDARTNSVDTGGATNVPARYYRIRLVP